MVYFKFIWNSYWRELVEEVLQCDAVAVVTDDPSEAGDDTDRLSVRSEQSYTSTSSVKASSVKAKKHGRPKINVKMGKY